MKCGTRSNSIQKIPQISSAGFRSAVSSAARVVLRAFGTVFSKSLSITTLGVGAFVVRCSFRRSLSDLLEIMVH